MIVQQVCPFHMHFGKGQTSVVIELEKGMHTLQLLMGDYVHIPHNKPVYSEKITINVQQSINMISIIIPTKNEANVIQETIRNLQDLRKNKICEIIIVDGKSDDETLN